MSYAGGLRISEIQNLKVKDVDFNELIIHIKQAKGKKDRITIFPEKLRLDFEIVYTILHDEVLPMLGLEFKDKKSKNG